jgi:HEAT repeat protein
MRATVTLLVACTLLAVVPPAPAGEPGTTEAVAGLVRQLKDPDPLAAQDAADELARLGPKAVEAVPDLVQALYRRETRRPAALALAAVGPEAVPALLDALDSPAARVADAAEDALVKIGPKAAAPLAATLRHQSEKVRYRAAEALGRIGPGADATIPALAEFLRDRDWGVVFDLPNQPKGLMQLMVTDGTRDPWNDRGAAALALARMGPKGVRVLVEASRDDGRINLRKAWTVAWQTEDTLRDSLQYIKDENPFLMAASVVIQLPKLAEAARERDFRTRQDAVHALRVSGDVSVETVAALAQALADPDEDVRREAVEALTRAGGKARAAVPALVAALRGPEPENFDWPFPRAPRLGVQPHPLAVLLVWALLEVAPGDDEVFDKEVVPFLVGRLRDPDLRVRGEAAQALAVLGRRAKAAAPAVAELLADKDRITEAPDDVTMAAARLGPAMLPALEKLLKDPDAGVRARTAKALARMGTAARPALPALKAAIGDEAAAVRAAAAEALGNFRTGDAGVVPPLKAALKDAEKEVRKEVVGALKQLAPGNEEAVAALGAALLDDDPEILLEAAEALAGRGADAREPGAALADVLRTGRRQAREEALWALGRLGPAAASAAGVVEDLMENGGDRGIRGDAAVALVRISPDRAERVAEKLGEWVLGDYAEAWTKALSRLGPVARAAVPDLLAALDDRAGRGVESRKEIIGALGAMGPDAAEAVPVLRKELGGNCRDEALRALGKIAPADGDVVTDLSVLLRDADRWVRADAARALGDAGPAAKAAVPRLKKLLDDEDGRVRAWAAYALVRITADEKTYLPPLLKGLREQDDHWIWRDFAEAVGRLAPGTRAAVPALAELLGSEDESVRGEVIGVLGRVGPAAAAAVPGLVKQLKKPTESNWLLPEAAQALGKIGPAAKDAIPVLEELTRGEDPWVASAAEEALRKIRADKRAKP